LAQYNFNTYILLKKDADPKAFEAQLETVVNKYVGEQAQQFLNTSLTEFRKQGNFDNYYLTALTKIHFIQ